MNFYLLGTILNMSAVLMVAGAGSYFSIAGGNFNLGGEGQIYAGGFAGAIALCSCSKMPAFAAIPLCLVFAGLVSAALTLFSALLKEYRKVDVLLSSFLISAGCIPVIDSFISGRFRGNTNNLLATEFIPKQFRFPSILKPSALNGGFFVAILLCVGLYFFMTRTSFGHQLKIFGVSPDFSKYSGFSSAKLTIVSVTVSGFLHGMAGFLCVPGMYYTCHSGFYAGFGWNGLSVALLASKNPLLIVPSAIILSAITTGASQFSLMHNFGFDMGMLLQGVILFLIVLLPALVKKIKGVKK